MSSKSHILRGVRRLFRSSRTFGVWGADAWRERSDCAMARTAATLTQLSLMPYKLVCALGAIGAVDAIIAAISGRHMSDAEAAAVLAILSVLAVGHAAWRLVHPTRSVYRSFRWIGRGSRYIERRLA